jgi:ABC-type transporter Mla MlaB component
VLRLEVRETEVGNLEMAVDGWPSGSDAATLRHEADRWRGSPGIINLDLTGVRHVDEAGLQLLNELRGETVQLRAGSPYIPAWTNPSR